MDARASAAAAGAVSPFSVQPPSRKSSVAGSRRCLIVASKGREEDFDLRHERKESNLVPFSPNHGDPIVPLSKDAAMGMVLGAVTGGWTTFSGMEGPPLPPSTSETCKVSTFPWSLFTKSPRRRMLIAFSCNVCGQRTTRAINPHAYTDGTVFVQCCGCNVFHKLVDNLNLFEGMTSYVNPDFNPKDDMVHDADDDDDVIFPGI